MFKLLDRQALFFLSSESKNTVMEEYMANRPYILVDMDPLLTYLLVSLF